MLLVLLHFRVQRRSKVVLLISMLKDLESQKKGSTELNSQKSKGCQVLKLTGNSARKLVVAN